MHHIETCCNCKPSPMHVFYKDVWRVSLMIAHITIVCFHPSLPTGAVCLCERNNLTFYPVQIKMCFYAFLGRKPRARK